MKPALEGMSKARAEARATAPAAKTRLMPKQRVMVQAQAGDGPKLAFFLGQNARDRPLHKPMQLRSLLLTAALVLLPWPPFRRRLRPQSSSLKDRYLTLIEDGKVIGKYPVAIGAPESPTLAGRYAVTKMDPQPVHHKKGKVIAPGPSNPVGVGYVAYVQIGTGEYAIHGTAWPNWVKSRAAVSLGCIRMLNEDVIQVYNRIKVGTPVVVTN